MFATITKSKQVRVFLSAGLLEGKESIGVRFYKNAARLTIESPRRAGIHFPLQKRNDGSNLTFVIPAWAHVYVRIGKFEVQTCPEGLVVDFSKPLVMENHGHVNAKCKDLLKRLRCKTPGLIPV